jgi:cell fate (sporulation/competence/biofilm development) regulator YlbF (YheA/YmcA/DUF963 family)
VTPSERDRYIERAAERMRSSLDTPNELGMADAEIDTLAAEAALSEVLDENARLKALLADYRRIQPDISLRAALSPDGGAERPEEET